MSRYVVILLVPLVIGSLIAIAILLINGLRERRDQRAMELREARRLNSRDFARPSARSSSDGEGRRIAS
jgi:hypothetical protein